MRVVYRQAALNELAALVETVAADKPQAARRVLAVIENYVEHLASFPLSAAIDESFANPPLKGMRRGVVTPYSSYVVFYFAREDEIEVVSIRRAERSAVSSSW